MSLPSIIRDKRPLRFTVDQYIDLERDMVGICRQCGEEKASCEPDARKYPCDHCGANEVYGTDELLARGELEIIE